VHKIVESRRLLQILSRIAERQTKKIAAYATDASRIDCPTERGEGKLTAEYYCSCFRKLRSGALPPANWKETHPNHVQDRKFAMPRALNMQFITHEEFLVRQSKDVFFFEPCAYTMYVYGVRKLIRKKKKQKNQLRAITQYKLNQLSSIVNHEYIVIHSYYFVEIITNNNIVWYIV